VQYFVMQSSSAIDEGISQAPDCWRSDVVSRCLEVAVRAGRWAMRVDDQGVSTPLMIERFGGEA